MGGIKWVWSNWAATGVSPVSKNRNTYGRRHKNTAERFGPDKYNPSASQTGKYFRGKRRLGQDFGTAVDYPLFCSLKLTIQLMPKRSVHIPK